MTGKRMPLRAGQGPRVTRQGEGEGATHYRKSLTRPLAPGPWPLTRSRRVDLSDGGR